MKPQIRTILDLLVANDFPYPVAIFPDQDFDLGPILSVLAFDVPESVFLDVSQDITDLLWPVETQPMLLASAIHDFESARQRAKLPEDTVWYEPRRTHAQTN
jgi:hypothetical protein